MWDGGKEGCGKARTGDFSGLGVKLLSPDLTQRPPGTPNYSYYAGGRARTVGGCSTGLHEKTGAAPARDVAWGLTTISGHCLVWECSVGDLKPASCMELVPALSLLWLAQPVPCPAQGSIAQISASAGHSVLQREMADGVWQPRAFPPLTPRIPRPQPCSPARGRIAARLLRGQRGTGTAKGWMVSHPNGSGRCFNYISHPTRWLEGLQTAADYHTPRGRTYPALPTPGQAAAASWRMQEGLKIWQPCCPRGRKENMK